MKGEIAHFVCQALPGDVAQCSNGHDVYKVTGCILPMSQISSTCFEAIGNQPPPRHGERIPHCHQCGEPWMACVPPFNSYRMYKVRRGS